MRRLLFVLALLAAAVAVARAADAEASDDGVDDSEVVGARLELCDECRMGQLPQLAAFIANEAPAFAALTVADVRGREPTLVLLNARRDPVSRHDVAAASRDDIVELLAAHGIYAWTPAPEWRPRRIAPTAHCAAWRQTAGCSARGEREPLADERCTIRISYDRSGYCECAGGLRIDNDCGHDEGSCDQMCERALGVETAAA